MIAGGSLHEDVFADVHESDKLKRLCRNITRTAVSENRLSLASIGKVRYELKTSYHLGTAPIFF